MRTRNASDATRVRRRDVHCRVRRRDRRGSRPVCFVVEVPRISEFYGIVIALYYNDHAPPHVHVIYAETEGRLRIDALGWLPGNGLPSRAARLTP